MLFSSLEFIYLFLPISLTVFYFSGKYYGRNTAVLWLCASSLFFYGYWNPPYILLLVSSIVFNYLVGRAITKSKLVRNRKLYLIIGVVVNIGLIFYYKYLGFFVWNINALFNSDLIVDHIFLPLAISFFTFQQISYLVDAYHGEVTKHKFSEYFLFVIFFPQLIAGPIVQQKDALHQYTCDKFSHFNLDYFLNGIALFALGLFKKVILADHLALVATPVFTKASEGEALYFVESWLGAIAYTFQLYFDFSGYSEMALGLGLMFGVLFPINFNAPFRARNIGEFWHRWHITLSNFLKYYLYIPLGGSRYGELFRLRNIAIVMLVSGLWHGAGWTFIIWGAIHATALVIYHAYSALKLPALPLVLGWFITMLITVVAFVFFRAESVQAAMLILKSMVGINGVTLSERILAFLPNFQGWLIAPVEGTHWLGTLSNDAFILIVASFAICLLLPRNVALFNFVEKREGTRKFKLSFASGVLIGLTLLISSLVFWTNITAEFLYYQF